MSDVPNDNNDIFMNPTFGRAPFDNRTTCNECVSFHRCSYVIHGTNNDVFIMSYRAYCTCGCFSILIIGIIDTIPLGVLLVVG